MTFTVLRCALARAHLRSGSITRYLKIAFFGRIWPAGRLQGGPCRAVGVVLVRRRVAFTPSGMQNQLASSSLTTITTAIVRRTGATKKKSWPVNSTTVTSLFHSSAARFMHHFCDGNADVTTGRLHDLCSAGVNDVHFGAVLPAFCDCPASMLSLVCDRIGRCSAAPMPCHCTLQAGSMQSARTLDAD